MKVDFKKFDGSLPYASELYGIYQPLLGWKSRQMRRRLETGIQQYRERFVARILPRFQPQFDLSSAVHPDEVQFKVMLAEPSRDGQSADDLNSVVADRVMSAIQQNGPDNPDVWKKYTSPEFVREALASSHDAIRQEYRDAISAKAFNGRAGMVHMAEMLRATTLRAETASSPQDLLSSILARESVLAGAITYLGQQAQPEQLMEFFRPADHLVEATFLLNLLALLNPRRSDLASAVISPIGIVHIFRQYFFEFDSFLGPSVQHLWLSPGGTVELVEVSTRKSIIERTTEMAFEQTEKTEKSSMTQDEISDAVRDENASNTKLGVSVNTSNNFGNAAIFTSQVNTGTSFEMDQSQKEAREQTHKGLRQQTEKASSEMRKSFKSTFKSVSETTDMTSKRYVIQNTTDKLLNYELRRKMRQVGVQVQDYGTQLCWQTYVDRPGDELGVARLVHIAQPADLSNVHDPEQLPPPEAEIKASAVSLDFEWFYEDRKYGFVPIAGTIQLSPPKPGFIYSRSEIIISSGLHWGFEAHPVDNVKVDTGRGDGSTEDDYRSLQVGVVTESGGLKTSDHPHFTLQVTAFFKPSQLLVKQVNDENTNRIKTANEEKARVFQATLFKEASDRVKAASNIQPRKFEELREEERIVVYRNLIRQLLKNTGVEDADYRVLHVFSELVQSMFDVDKMLYFVAPEWWVPRPLPGNHINPQEVGLGDQAVAFDSMDVVSWGGAKAQRPDNYYITEDSTPARLGSSLGWLIQLDGDNMRNAFLNAPWVKAVIPIRLGREWKALQWLSTDDIEGSDGLNALYQANSDDERKQMISKLKAYAWNDDVLVNRYQTLAPGDITILDALRYLIVRIEEKEKLAQEKIPGLSYLPTDKVYEHGFDPLQGGFQAEGQQPFEVFDQWIEVVPTDQIVPVEVVYDPKTGMQK